MVIALGPFKALVHTEACLVFEAGRVDVAHIAPVLAELMRANAKVRGGILRVLRANVKDIAGEC